MYWSLIEFYVNEKIVHEQRQKAAKTHVFQQINNLNKNLHLIIFTKETIIYK